MPPYSLYSVPTEHATPLSLYSRNKATWKSSPTNTSNWTSPTTWLAISCTILDPARSTDAYNLWQKIVSPARKKQKRHNYLPPARNSSRYRQTYSPTSPRQNPARAFWNNRPFYLYPVEKYILKNRHQLPFLPHTISASCRATLSRGFPLSRARQLPRHLFSGTRHRQAPLFPILLSTDFAILPRSSPRTDGQIPASASAPSPLYPPRNDRYPKHPNTASRHSTSRNSRFSRRQATPRPNAMS